MQGPTQPRRRPEKLGVTSLDAGTPQERKSTETGRVRARGDTG